MFNFNLYIDMEKINLFYFISLDIENGGCDSICYSFNSLFKVLSEYKQLLVSDKESITIEKRLIVNTELNKLSKQEFESLFFDNIDDVVEGTKVIEKITLK